MPEEAFRVHGLSAEFLAEHPVFAEVVDEFLEFVGDGRLVIHNASVRHALPQRRADAAATARCSPHDRAIDTLLLAQRRFPGTGNSLDALCKRFSVDNTARKLHGALLDCELLAEVYLHLMGGRQADLGLVLPAVQLAAAATRTPRPARPHAASPEELAAHAAFIAGIENPIWAT